MERNRGRFVLEIFVVASSWMLTAGCGGNGDAALPLTPSSTPPVTNDTGVSSGIEPGARFIVDIVSARGATLETVIIAPSGIAKAAVILLEGDDGTIDLGGTPDDPEIQSEGFLARNADAFASQGLLVALVGAPSDYAAGVEISYRITTQQSDDVAAVVAWIDARASLPIWVLGMSLGTFSATNSAIRLNGVVDGFAVCSASTAPTGGPMPNGILDMELDQIAMPALIVGHQDDACPGTPASGVAAIADALTSAGLVTQRVFTGGSPPMSQPCGPKSPHGYFGIDDQVVTYMAGVMQ